MLSAKKRLEKKQLDYEEAMKGRASSALMDSGYQSRMYYWLSGHKNNIFLNGKTNKEMFIEWFGETPKEFRASGRLLTRQQCKRK